MRHVRVVQEPFTGEMKIMRHRISQLHEHAHQESALHTNPTQMSRRWS